MYIVPFFHRLANENTHSHKHTACTAFLCMCLLHIRLGAFPVKARGHAACVFMHLAEVKKQHFLFPCVDCVSSLLCGMSVGISQPVSCLTRLRSVDAAVNPEMTFSTPNAYTRADPHSHTHTVFHALVCETRRRKPELQRSRLIQTTADREINHTRNELR